MPSHRGDEEWSPWFGPVAFLTAVVLTAVSTLTLSGLLAVLLDVSRNAPGLLIFATLVQDAAFVLVAVALAARVARPSPAAFGMRPMPPARVLKSTVLAAGLFLGISLLYGLLVSPEGEQSSLERLGADRGGALLVAAGVLVILVAPFAEEVFFRGFFYRALRNRHSVAVAVTLNATLFGLIHFDGAGTLVLLPLLAVLGAFFCLLYEWTGSLYPAIALHVVNNALAFGAAESGDALLGLGLGLAGIALVVALAARPLARVRS